MCENQLRGLDAVCHTELEKTTIDVIYEGDLTENATLVKYSVLDVRETGQKTTSKK